MKHCSPIPTPNPLHSQSRSGLVRGRGYYYLHFHSRLLPSLHLSSGSARSFNFLHFSSFSSLVFTYSKIPENFQPEHYISPCKTIKISAREMCVPCFLAMFVPINHQENLCPKWAENNLPCIAFKILPPVFDALRALWALLYGFYARSLGADPSTRVLQNT